MPYLSENNRQYIERLREWYQSLPDEEKRRFPSRVSSALLDYQSESENESAQALGLCRAFLNEDGSISRWPSSAACLAMFSRSPLILAVYELNRAGLLTGDVAQANFDEVAGHQHPQSLTAALDVLNDARLLAGEAAQFNRGAVVGHQSPYLAASALRMLKEAGLLTGDAAQANRDAVAGHQAPQEVARALDLLNHAGLLTGVAAQANRDAVAAHQDPCEVAEALGALYSVGLLTGDSAQVNRDAVAGHQASWLVAEALGMLNRVGLLTGDSAQANRDAVAGHQNPWWVAIALDVLNRIGLLIGDLAQANRDAVAGHQDSRAVGSTLTLLNDAGLLTGDAAQANFDAVILHSAILLHAEITVFWSRMPTHRFTLARFTALIEICQRHADNPAAGRALVIAYINGEMLGMNETTAAEAPRFNEGQSTHTASVHQTVSESARRLMVSYGNQISGRGLNETIQELSTWLNAQPNLSRQVIKAKLCLQRLTTAGYFFIDLSSHVSMKQLLALFWIAIHDDGCRKGTLDDAKLQLIDGLYEIQREYNFSATGEDNGREGDEPSCPAGAFNKVIEKGQGVHPDMVVDFISMAGFSLKIPLVVNEVAMAYLKSLDILNLRPLIEAIKAEDNSNSVGPIWAEIRTVVAERMFNEFGSLFRNDRTTREFLSAIAAGEFCSLNPNHLSELDRLIGQVSQDGAAAASLGTAPDGFFAAAATLGTNDNTTPSVAEAPHP